METDLRHLTSRNYNREKMPGTAQARTPALPNVTQVDADWNSSLSAVLSPPMRYEPEATVTLPPVMELNIGE
jgi:hypothetical protein